MSSKAHVDRLAKLLEATGMCQTVSKNFGENTVSVMLRVGKGNEKPWIRLIRNIRLLEKARRGGPEAFQVHICRHYFLRDDEEQTLVYAWNLSIQSSVMTEVLSGFMAAIDGEVPTPVPTKRRFEVENMPITGLEGVVDRNKPKPGKKKGAYTADTVPIDRR